MERPCFRIFALVFLAVSALMVAGCGGKHRREYERDSFYPSPPSRQQFDDFFAQAPGFQNIGTPAPVVTQAASAVVTQPASTPKPQAVTYPIHKVVNGEKHSISVHPTGVAETSSLLIERIVPVQVTLKKDFECRVTLTNISKNALYDVTVTEPHSFVFKSAKPVPVSHRDGTLIWDLGKMAPEETRTITMRGHAISPKRISDCVTVVYSSVQQACADIEVVNPSLKLMQTGPRSVIQCQSIPIVLEVTNSGSGLARNVIIREALPEGLLTLDDKKVLSFQAGNLKAGESKTVKVNLKALRKGEFKTRAQATSEDNVKADADYAVKVTRPELVLTASGPQKRYVSRTAQYEITVTNRGDSPANNLLITEMVPPGATYVSASDGGVAGNGMVVWNVGTLDPLASRKVSVLIRLDRIGTIVHNVKVQAYCAAASAKCETVVEGIAAILLEVVDLDDPVEIGSNSTYLIRVTNQGSAVGTNINVVATLPDELEYVGSSGPTEAKVSGKIVSFVPLSNLAAKQTVVYRVEVKGIKTGDLRFHVELQSDQMTSPVMETESTNVY